MKGKKSSARNRAEERKVRADRNAKSQFKVAYGTSKWPAFVFDVEDADSGFVEEIKKAVTAFRFESLASLYQDAFLVYKQDGCDAASAFIHGVFEALRKINPHEPKFIFGEEQWVGVPGGQILDLIPASACANLFPFHDARFLPYGRNILVECRSLARVHTGRETLWYSPHKPTVEVNGKRYIVAFTPHAIENIQKRISPRQDYMALGDICAYIHETVYYETCLIRNRTTKLYDQLAVTFYADCGYPPYFSWYAYVDRVLGKESLNPDMGKPYYRLGYCPAFPEGDFIKLTTLLYPGYFATPEYRALMEASLPQHEKDRLEAMAIHDDGADNLLKTGDFSAVKWFHDNGVSQVIQTKMTISKQRLRDHYVISDMILK